MAETAAATGQHCSAGVRSKIAGIGPRAEFAGPAHLVRTAAQEQLVGQAYGGTVMESFRAYRIHEESKKIVARFEQLKLDDLSPGDVVVRVTHSDINYKDALAATGAGKILRRYPLVGGIDFAGVVESSADSRYSAGAPGTVTGWSRTVRRRSGGRLLLRAPPAEWAALPSICWLGGATRW